MNRPRLSAASLCALALAALAVAQTAPRTDRLVNLSTRGRIVAGQNDLVAGFVIGGTQPKTVLLRGAGPALGAFGLPDPLAAPRLRLYDAQGRVLREVVGWGGDITYAATFARLGAFPFAVGSADVALVTTLAPGTYTMQITASLGAGAVLAEIYDASPDPQGEFQRLINISSRGTVGSGETALIGGFVITGNAPKKVLVRGVGPGLAAFSVAGPLADPRLAVFSGPTVVAQNNDWATPLAVGTGQILATAAEIAEAARLTGAFAFAANSKDAAVILTLAPGAYTAQVTSADGTTTGVALVEIYELPQ